MSEGQGDEVHVAANDRVAAVLRLGEGEILERAYVFEPVERKGISFLLALVTKRRSDGGLEMAALGSRAGSPGLVELEFARRARFPDDVLPTILAEIIERCDAEGAAYREIDLDLAAGTPAEAQVAALVEQLLPAASST